MVMGRIIINCYEMDFTVGAVHYAVSGIAFGFTSVTSAVTRVVHAILYPFNNIPSLPFLFRKQLEVFCCTNCSAP